MLPALVWSMAQRLRASIPPPRATIRATFNDVLTEEDYNQALKRQVWRQSVVPIKHRVETHAGLEVDGEQWQCDSYDGCMCSCTQWTEARDEALLLAVRAEGSAAWQYRAPHNVTAHDNAWRRIARQLRHDPSFGSIFRTAQEPGFYKGVLRRVERKLALAEGPWASWPDRECTLADLRLKRLGMTGVQITQRPQGRARLEEAVGCHRPPSSPHSSSRRQGPVWTL